MLTLPWSQNPAASGGSSKVMVQSSKDPPKEEDNEEQAFKPFKSGRHHKKQRSHHHHPGHEEHHHRFRGTDTSKSNQPATGTCTQRQTQASLAAVGAVAAYGSLRGSSLAAIGAVAGYGALRGSIKIFHYARRAMLRQLLLDLCPALQKAGYYYWLDFGSLLGIHRDGDLILHDNDIDLAILNPQWDQIHSRLSCSLPQYTVKLEFPSDADGQTTFLRVYCSLGFADVFGAVELEDKGLLVDCGHGEMNCIPTELVLPTKCIEFKGVEIQVPRDLNGTLQLRYGPTWRVPRYMDKGADTVEEKKTYARVFKALSKVGIRL